MKLKPRGLWAILHGRLRFSKVGLKPQHPHIQYGGFVFIYGAWFHSHPRSNDSQILIRSIDFENNRLDSEKKTVNCYKLLKHLGWYKLYL